MKKRVLCPDRLRKVPPQFNLEFTLAETLEHFLACHQHAFEYFNGVPQQVWVDNCKVAVLSRAPGSIVFNPRRHS
jgi:transposase